MGMAAPLQCLVVDDSPIIRRILGLMLSRLGFALIEADTVQGALSLCAGSHPDLVVVDWNLPDQDGISLVQQLRRLPGGEKMKLVMCTSERSVSHIETALSAGADEYISKPFGIEVLETKLGYLGFDVAQAITDPRARRQISRLAFTTMTCAEPDEASFAAGQAIFQAGEAPDFAYLLLDGEVTLQGGRRALPFDLIGEAALTESSPRRADAVAATDCALIRLSRAAFQAELALLSPFMRAWVENLHGCETE